MIFRRGVAILGAVTIACGGGAAEPEMPGATSQEKFGRTRYTIVWSDPAGLDLMSPEGTYVRASIESLDVSAVNGNTDAAAPGFWDTLAGPAKSEAQNFFKMGPARGEYGVKRYEILSRTADASAMTVTVCAYNQQLGHEIATQKYEFGGTGPFGTVITFQRAGESVPPARQSGRETFVAAKVFGSWRTTAWQTGHFAGGDPCAGRPLPGVAPGSWPQTRGSGPYVTDRLPRESNYPGWPGSDG